MLPNKYVLINVQDVYVLFGIMFILKDRKVNQVLACLWVYLLW